MSAVRRSLPVTHAARHGNKEGPVATLDDSIATSRHAKRMGILDAPVHARRAP